MGAFKKPWRELAKVLRKTEFPLRDTEPFRAKGRPLTPKRQRKDVKNNRYALMPIDQDALNLALHARLAKLEGWETQPLVLGKTLGRELESFLKGDFKKAGMFVEVEFGNTASLFRDLFKFQLVSQSKMGQVAVLVVATDRAARLMDSNVATFERVVSLLPFLDFVVALPILIVGIEPSDWTPIRKHYNRMKRVAEKHRVKCYTFEEASGL